MNNKLLVKVYSIDVDKNFDLFIPINDYVWKEIKLIVKSISDLTMGSLSLQNDYVLINAETGQIYNYNDIVYDTDITNMTKLFLKMI